ncbi:unnamed protein product [Chondrus crispus]|uniref:Uncharacterized protein n=1 Tax=Chondrus crispus TaxID=2769 RepID=R7Q2V1_CHOCR|nr:unnamed protein product [Chondrus crispus]CDF32359.1 unnamed protein product [Chondrus crispus]|eukprot:XP_005712024.1 unnamed protein product [Chondrus crispus]
MFIISRNSFYRVWFTSQIPNCRFWAKKRGGASLTAFRSTAPRQFILSGTQLIETLLWTQFSSIASVVIF